MEIPKVVIIGVDFKDLKKGATSQHLFAEVVLIDKTQQSLQPLLYQYTHDDQIQDPYLLLSKTDFSALDTKSFMMLGEVVSIDKRNKCIILSNDNTVSYNYLIIASGAKHGNLGSELTEEFAPGLQALIEALKIKKEIPFVIGQPPAQSKKRAQLSIAQPPNTNPSRDIGKLANHYILSGTLNPLSIYLSGIERRLYEVHT